MASPLGAIRRRMRARLLRPEDSRPLTAVGWLADLAKVFVLLVLLGTIVLMLMAGTPLFRAILITGFGYRTIGRLDEFLVTAFFFIALPAAFLAFAFCLVIVMWTYRSMNWIGTHLLLTIPVVGFTFYFVRGSVVGPPLDRYQHLNNWPAQLELRSFNVCAIEIVEERSRTLAPVGRITLSLTNRSATAITEAVFSVKAGSNWYHVPVTDLPPGANRHAMLERDLGVIEEELAGNFAGWAHRGAELYWDHVSPRDVLEQPVIRRPEIADVGPIGDCPRHDISGVWKGADGAELTLSQRGRHPQGYVKGGGLEQTGELSGDFDGTTFSGPLHRRGGTFQLKLTPDGRLQGQWTLAERNGTWTLTRTGPAPPAPRRR